MAQVNTRVLEPSTTRQQTSTGSDVWDFVMNELTRDFRGGDTLGLGGHEKEVVPVQ
jgi:hypothetical protein